MKRLVLLITIFLLSFSVYACDFGPNCQTIYTGITGIAPVPNCIYAYTDQGFRYKIDSHTSAKDGEEFSRTYSCSYYCGVKFGYDDAWGNMGFKDWHMETVNRKIEAVLPKNTTINVYRRDETTYSGYERARQKEQVCLTHNTIRWVTYLIDTIENVSVSVYLITSHN